MWWRKNIPFFFIIIFLVMIQSSFFSNSQFWLNNIQLVFLFLLLLLLLSSYSFIFILKWAVFAGILMDMFSQFTFGTYTIALVLTQFLIYFLFQRFFTNKSYYSLIVLVTSGTLFFNFFLIISSLFFQTINVNLFGIEFGGSLIFSILFQLLINLFISTIAFRIFKSFSPSLT